MSTPPDAGYMKRAIEIALKGEGHVHPNPMVGAVIVKEGRIISEGFHEKYGQLHAERNAILNAKEDCSGATIYVTLEPCCHYGKTPPCTEAIIDAGISRVVIGSKDPNPKVSGGGVAALQAAGIEVIQDFLKDECDAINPVFFHYIKTGRPFVTLKYAMTLDGKIATKTGASKWITGEESRQYVHGLRHASMAIMTGSGTVLKDDPMLNCRVEGGLDPIRVICDSGLSISLESNIVKSAKDIETIVSCAFLDENAIPKEKLSALEAAGIRVINLPGSDGRVDLFALMGHLGDLGIDSVLIESGGIFAESALKSGIVNRIHAFVAPKIFGGSAKSPVEGVGVGHPDEAFQFKLFSTKVFGDDILLIYDRL